ncbi:colicin E3/pyocin S6 family cytotoxin, partial [Bacillus mycoides]
IRLKHSVDEAKPQLEELVQVTRENAPIIARDLQALDAKVPGFFTDFNMGIDLANTFMDSANRIASHKIDIPAGSIGSIDLTNAFRDFGVTPEKMRELEQADRDTTKFMNASLDVWPIINVPKEIIQLVQGHEMGEKDKYKPSDYAIGVASVLTGGTVKTVKTIGNVVGTVGDIEKKAKNLEKAAKGGRFDVAAFDKKIAKMNVNERVAEIKTVSREVANQKGWKKDNKRTKMNKREVYYDKKTDTYYAIDTQHGRFEVVNSKGKHQGEVDFNLNQTKPADKSGGHDLIMS